MKKLSPRLKRIIFLAIALVLVIVITNPAAMFFLPSSAKASLSEAWHSAFGNVNQITNTLRINWISIFQIVLVNSRSSIGWMKVMAMMFCGWVCRTTLFFGSTESLAICDIR